MRLANPSTDDILRTLMHFQGRSFFTNTLALIDSVVNMPEPEFAQRETFDSLIMRGFCQVPLADSYSGDCVG